MKHNIHEGKWFISSTGLVAQRDTSKGEDMEWRIQVLGDPESFVWIGESYMPHAQLLIPRGEVSDLCRWQFDKGVLWGQSHPEPSLDSEPGHDTV